MKHILVHSKQYTTTTFSPRKELNKISLKLSGTVSTKTEYDKLHRGRAYCKACVLDYMMLVSLFLECQDEAPYCDKHVI